MEHKPHNFRRGDVFYANLEPHLGSEQGGIRPVLILQNNAGNRHSSTLIVAAITSRVEKKPKLPTHVFLDRIPGMHAEIKSTVLLEQILTIDKTRLRGYIGYLPAGTMEKVDNALITSLAL